MDTLTAIFTRRSVRSFTTDTVSDDQVHTLLRAAMQAPSAGNQQPWHFVVVRDRLLLNRLVTINPNAEMCAQASVAILICADERLERFQDYWVQDCSAAGQNILLAAHALGLGTVWTGIHPLEDRIRGYRSLFRLPDHIHPLALIAIGTASEPLPPIDRYRGDRVHHDAW